MKNLDSLTGRKARTDLPDFNVGDTVVVGVKIVEGGKEKQQEFRGVVLACRGKGLGKTFLVRKVAFGEGVERTFFLNSPMVNSIKIIKRGKTRRSKLYYLRDKVGKKAKLKDRIYVENPVEPEEAKVDEIKAEAVPEINE